MENFLWMVLGSTISAWTGLVTARYFEFNQRLIQAREIFTMVDLVLLDDKTRVIRKNDLIRIQILIQTVFHQQGQFEVQRRFNWLCDKMRECLSRLEIQVAAARAAQDLDASRHAFEAFNQDADALLRDLQKIRPHSIPLLFGHWFSRTVVFARYAYENFCEHLETGRPISEINERRQRR